MYFTLKGMKRRSNLTFKYFTSCGTFQYTCRLTRGVPTKEVKANFPLKIDPSAIVLNTCSKSFLLKAANYVKTHEEFINKCTMMPPQFHGNAQNTMQL